jgi:hypothetical protein
MSLYKIVNLTAAGLFGVTAFVVNYYVNQGYCVDRCGFELMRSFVNPVGISTPIITGVLVFLLLFPADLFRRWLWYLGGPFLILTVIAISNISIYDSGILAFRRGPMAELLMQTLAVLTVIYVVAYYVWQGYWRKNDPSEKIITLNPK